jgi:hypothetical protein
VAKIVSNNFRCGVRRKVIVMNKHAYAISSGNLSPYTLRVEFYIIPAAAGTQAGGNGCYNATTASLVYIWPVAPVNGISVRK